MWTDQVLRCALRRQLQTFCVVVLVAFSAGCSGVQEEASERVGGITLKMPKAKYSIGEPVWYYLRLSPREGDEYLLSCVDAWILQVHLKRGDEVVDPLPFASDGGYQPERLAGVYDKYLRLVRCRVQLIPVGDICSLAFRVPLNYKSSVTHEIFDLLPGAYTLRVSYRTRFYYEMENVLEDTGVERIEEAPVFGNSGPETSNEVSFVVR